MEAETTTKTIEKVTDEFLAELLEVGVRFDDGGRPLSEQVSRVIRVLAREVQERRAAERPIPVSERLPDFGEEVLLYDTADDSWSISFRAGNEALWWWAGKPLDCLDTISHWHSLLAPPPKPEAT